MFVPCAPLQQLLLLPFPPTALSIPHKPLELPGIEDPQPFLMKRLLNSSPAALISSVSAAGWWVSWVTLVSSGSQRVVVGEVPGGFREPAV